MAKKYRIKVIDPNTALLNEETIERGQLFWDRVHLTAYGHEVWGQHILKEALDEIGKKREPKCPPRFNL